MIEVVSSYPDIHQVEHKPLDGLRALRDQAFVASWIGSENEIQRQKSIRGGDYVQAMGLATLSLNNQYETSELRGEKVIATGKAYRVLYGGGEIFSESDAEQLESATMQFDEITFVPVTYPGKFREVEKHRAAFRLKPVDGASGPDTSHFYMLLDDAEQLDYESLIVPDISLKDLDKTLDDMHGDFAAFRMAVYDETHTEGQRYAALDERVREYKKQLQPLIDHVVPLMINSDKFTKVVDGRRRRDTVTENPVDGECIAGALKNVEIIDNFLHPGLVPHLVIRNNFEQTTYTVPINAAVRNLLTLEQ